ncbi:MAG: hypothetical protein PVG74_20105, partial [Desulfobacterales bacterium]
KNFVDYAKNSEFVMPDLIRHPEFYEFNGFRPSPQRRYNEILIILRVPSGLCERLTDLKSFFF